MHTRLTPLTGKLRAPFVFVGASLLIITAGCGTPNSPMTQPKTAPSVMDVAASPSGTTPTVLLFVGTGTSSGDVSAVKTILGDLKLSYATATSSQLDGMSESSLLKYKLFLMPGGDAVTIGNHLTVTATTTVHNAVVNGGMHYLGICAGGFFADNSIFNYLGITTPVYDFYADHYKGINKEAVEISQPDGTKLDQYWQDGPELNGWGDVVGRYPNGSAAVVEGKSGKGWVILSAVHPEAPASWRTGMKFTTSVQVDNAYAETLVKAALNETSLPHF